MSRRWWPGHKWRILAHCKATPTSKEDYLPDGRVQLSSDDYPFTVQFDELVIDDWLHVEQMSERHWWIGVGNGDDYWHVNVTIDTARQARVSMEKQS